MFKNHAYETAIRVLENHISRQNRVIQELLSKVLKEDVQLLDDPRASLPDEDADFEERYKPMFEAKELEEPGSIINKDS